MNKSIEKAFEESWLNDYYHGNYKGHAQVGFYAGAQWQAKQSPWISVEERLPEDEQIVLCSSQIYGKVVLCWDELSQSWSYPETDEFYCDRYSVDCWMPIPA